MQTLAPSPLPVLNRQQFAAPYHQERIIQFGTGVLLRGLVDFAVQQANEANEFSGCIVQIKSTNAGRGEAFDEQDQLYTVAIRGVENGQLVEHYQVNTAISRTLIASQQWRETLALASQPALNIIVSNTTEAGLYYEPKDEATAELPISFPGKLLALLKERFRHGNGGKGSGYTIIPTELISDNGQVLKKLIVQLAKAQKLTLNFFHWLEMENRFCSSLVDRIVPGKPSTEKLQEHWEKLGYQDQLLIEAEPYLLWAIEGDADVKKELRFAQENRGVVVAPDITQYKEFKLRILNGSHSFLCAHALLQQQSLVRESMAIDDFKSFAKDLMGEIFQSLPYEARELKDYAASVADRFANPFIDHQWRSIALNYTGKMRLRNLPTIHRYLAVNDNLVPAAMAKGFAAYLQLMHTLETGSNKEFVVGQKGETFPFADPDAAVIYRLKTSQANFYQAMLERAELWGENLHQTMPAFAAAVMNICLKNSSPNA